MVASGLPERVSAELQYFEVKFAAQMSYGLTVNVLQEVLPLDHVLAASSIRRQVTALGRRLEAELATDARQQGGDGRDRRFARYPGTQSGPRGRH